MESGGAPPHLLHGQNTLGTARDANRFYFIWDRAQFYIDITFIFLFQFLPF